MARPFLRLYAATKADDKEASRCVDAALSASGAAVVNFSNVSKNATVLAFAVPGHRVPALASRLEESPVSLYQISREVIAHWPARDLADIEIRGSLKLTYLPQPARP